LAASNRSLPVWAGRPVSPKRREVEPSVEVRRLKVTGKRRIERMQRVSQMLSMRRQGASLAQIADAQDPPISFQAVHKALKTALREMVIEPLEQVRTLELLRSDELLSSIYENALAGDIACIDRCLAIMYRRARLTGLDLQPGGVLRFSDHGPFEDDAQPVMRVEIVGNPEIERVRWLEGERTRLLAAGVVVGT
jgi:hypothetical protein